MHEESQFEVMFVCSVCFKTTCTLHHFLSISLIEQQSIMGNIPTSIVGIYNRWGLLVIYFFPEATRKNMAHNSLSMYS